MKYLHLRNIKNGKALSKGGVTVAYEAPLPEENTIKIAIAYCSDSDNFSRKIGRAVAEGRWEAAFVNGKPTRHVRIVPLFNQTPVNAIIESLK